MKSKVFVVLLLISIVLTNCSADPQLADLVLSIGKPLAQQKDTIVDQVRKIATTVKDYVSENQWIQNALIEFAVMYMSKNSQESLQQSSQKTSQQSSQQCSEEEKEKKRPCAVHITSLPELQPVYEKYGSLMVPTNGFLTWAHGETSSIACPPSASGTPNWISLTNNRVETIKCIKEHMFEMNGKRVDIRAITCARRVTGAYQWRKDSQCVGTNKAIGFYVFMNQFYDLFHSCIDETKATVLYTRHVLYGSEISHKCTNGRYRPNFKPNGFPRDFVNEAYPQVKQKARLVELFSVRDKNTALADAERYIFLNSYLERGHLTPDADELFTTWQWSTYFYVNVAAMWKPINTGNWKTLETKIRSLANKLQLKMEIYTGTYGTLALCSSANYCPEFTLDGGIPVPKWLWKIVKVPSLNVAIALVVSNNPFMSVDPICGSKQVNYGWYQNKFDQFQHGEVSYCRVGELRNVVGYIPQEALATNVLPYP